MPEITGNQVLPGDEAIKEGKVYKIVSVEKFTSEVQMFSGYRVTLDGGKHDQIAIPLWERQTIGRRSKLGAFAYTLGLDTDKWVGKNIRIVFWIPRNRQIEVVL